MHVRIHPVNVLYLHQATATHTCQETKTNPGYCPTCQARPGEYFPRLLPTETRNAEPMGLAPAHVKGKYSPTYPAPRNARRALQRMVVIAERLRQQPLGSCWRPTEHHARREL